MPNKRDEIRENAKRADELAKQLATEGSLMPKDGSKTSVFSNQVPDLKVPTVENAVVESVKEEPAKESVPVATVQSANENLTTEVSNEVEASVSEKQYKSAVKAMNEAQRKAADAERLLKQQTEEHEKFKQELLAIKQQRVQGEPEVEKVSSIDQALMKWQEEYPDTVNINRAASNAVKKELESMIQNKFASVDEQLNIARQEQEKVKFLEQVRLRDERVKAVHTDYDDVRLSDDFKTWIYGEAPSIYQGVYEGNISFDDKDAVKIIGDFKSYKKSLEPSKPTFVSPKPGSAEVAVKTSASVGPDMGLETESDFTADDVAKLPYIIHRIKDPAQRKVLMEKADKFMSKQLSKTK